MNNSASPFLFGRLFRRGKRTATECFFALFITGGPRASTLFGLCLLQTPLNVGNILLDVDQHLLLVHIRRSVLSTPIVWGWVFDFQINYCLWSVFTNGASKNVLLSKLQKETQINCFFLLLFLTLIWKWNAWWWISDVEC